jgi:hypothetical protein
MSGGYGTVKGRGGNANAILRGLSRFEPKLAGLLNKMSDEQATDDAVKDFQEGNEPNNTLTKYQTVYGKLQGMERANSLHTDITSWLAKNPEALPEEYNVAKAQLLESHAEGLTDFALQTFLPNAIDSYGKVDNQYQQLQVTKMRNDTHNKVSAVTSGNIYRILESGLEGAELNDAMHRNLMNAHINYGGGALKRKELSNAHFQAARSIAIKLGRPELLDYTMIPDKENGGIALINTDLAGEIDTARRLAEAAKLRIQKANDKIDAEKKDVAIGAVEKAMSEFTATDTNASSGIREMIEKVRKDHKLTDTETKSLYGSLEVLEGHQGWAKTTDPIEYGKAILLAEQGRLTPEYLESKKSYLGRATAQALMAKNAQTRTTRSGTKKADSDVEKLPLQMMKARIVGGDVVDNYAKANKWYYGKVIYDKLRDQVTKNGTQPITYDDSMKLTSLVLERLKEMDKDEVDFEQAVIDVGDVNLQELAQRITPEKGYKTKEEERQEQDAVFKQLRADEAKAEAEAEAEAKKQAANKEMQLDEDLTF